MFDGPARTVHRDPADVCVGPELASNASGRVVADDYSSR
jgi:hypothetical protein